MTFNILDKLKDLNNVKEFNSYVQADCPVCGGLLKISKSDTHYGAYRCWTNYCAAQDIRNKLPSSPYNVFTQSSPFKRSNIFDLPANCIDPNLDIPKEFEFVLLNKVIRISERVGNKIIYKYDKDKRVVRYDNTNKIGYRKKAIIPEYFDEADNLWKFGKNNTLWPFYGKLELLENLKIQKQQNKKSGKVSSYAVIAVEGEKTCDWVRRLGLSCITFQTSQYGIIAVKDQLQCLLSSLDLIIYVEDNDQPGRYKGDTVKKGCNLAGLPSVKIPYKKLNPNAEDEDDLADSDFKTKEDLMASIRTYILNLTLD